METIKTIDLWTEPSENYMELYTGAFSDGWAGDKKPYDSYKIVKHCNCEIKCSDSAIVVGNKHNAIIFYRNGKPVRLVVAQEGTDIESCVEKALATKIKHSTIGNVLALRGVKSESVDLEEEPIYNAHNNSGKPEVDIGSCDRARLFNQMLDGSYTEDTSDCGTGKTEKRTFKNIRLRYHLVVGDEEFDILNVGAFLNSDMTQIILLQSDSQFKTKYVGEENNV